MHRGFIPLHRKLKDHWLYSDNNKLASWIKVLIECNHKDGKKLIDGDLIDCNRGQSINSLNTWSLIFGKGWTAKKVKTFFVLLESDNMLVFEGLRKTSRVTICNYESYNNQGNTEVTQKKHRSNTEVNERSTNNNDNNENNDNNTPKVEATFINTSFKKWDLNMFKESIKEANKKNEYHDQLRKSFYRYWIEPNEKGKMRFQLNKTWSTKGRLTTFKNNENKG